MIAFSHFYVGRTFVLYDVGIESVAGRRRYVATLSADPRVQFAGADPADAAAKLRRFVVGQLARQAARAA